ncbi:MAG: NUDIX hydrolase [Nitrospirota bacterium]|nr:MAG: NUDIX hydrolase [Nitrospirota bacterium]
MTANKNIYSGKVLILNIEHVSLPNGETADLEIIRHPGAAAIVPLKEDGTVVLIRQFRHAAGGYIYEIPAGKLHPGEDPQDCAARELEEEIGYRANSLEFVTNIFTAPGFADEVIHIYKATDLMPGQQQLDRDEVLEVIEWPLVMAMDRIRDHTIRDAKTIIGLQAVYLAMKVDRFSQPPSQP